MAEVAIPRSLFADILRLIAELRLPAMASTGSCVGVSKATGDVCLQGRKFTVVWLATGSQHTLQNASATQSDASFLQIAASTGNLRFTEGSI